MEASALNHASQRGFLARRSPLLRLQGDEKLIAMARGGNAGAFEMIVDRYQSRLLGFCRQMLGSTEDAEDVLQEVFVNAYRAMLADEREINLRPWLYRIARNRCLNHLRKPTADAQESMDMVPVVEAASTAEKVGNREEFRELLTDVGKLPETQRSALLFREMDAMSYEEIAAAMETSVPSVKSLLVRARISLAEASQARQLTCGEVRLELAEAAEGLRKVTGPARRHVRDCEECADFRSQVRANDKAMAALFPIGPLVALKAFLVSKLGLGGAAGSATGGASAAGAGAGAGATATATAGAGAVGAAGAAGAATAGAGAAGGIGAVGGAIGSKAVAGVVTAAVITAGAVEVNKDAETNPVPKAAAPATISKGNGPSISKAHAAPAREQPVVAQQASAPVTEAPPVAPPAEPATPAQEPAPPAEGDSAGPSASAESEKDESDDEPKASTPKITAAQSPAGQAGAPTGETVVVTVGGTVPPPPAEATPPPAEGSEPSEPSKSPAEEGEPPVESEPPPPSEESEPTSPSEGGASEEEAPEEASQGETSREPPEEEASSEGSAGN